MERLRQQGNLNLNVHTLPNRGEVGAKMGAPEARSRDDGLAEIGSGSAWYTELDGCLGVSA